MGMFLTEMLARVRDLDLSSRYILADRIMQFGMVSGVGRGMVFLMGLVIVKGEWAVLRVNFGHPIVTNGDFIHSYVEVHESIELSFGMVSQVSLGIRVLDGGPCVSGVHVSQWERGFQVFCPETGPLISMAYFLHRNIFDSYEKS